MGCQFSEFEILFSQKQERFADCCKLNQQSGLENRGLIPGPLQPAIIAFALKELFAPHAGIWLAEYTPVHTGDDVADKVEYEYIHNDVNINTIYMCDINVNLLCFSLDEPLMPD